jgi:hypothetical protein
VSVERRYATTAVVRYSFPGIEMPGKGQAPLGGAIPIMRRGGMQVSSSIQNWLLHFKKHPLMDRLTMRVGGKQHVFYFFKDASNRGEIISKTLRGE